MTRDAWGRPNPAAMDRVGRINCLRQAAGALQAADDPVFVWLGKAIVAAFQEGTTIDRALGIVAPAGVKNTPRRIILTEQQQVLLLRLSTALGSDKKASAVLTGRVSTPPEVADLVTELKRLKAPASVWAFTRARNSRFPT